MTHVLSHLTILLVLSDFVTNKEIKLISHYSCMTSSMVGTKMKISTTKHGNIVYKDQSYTSSLHMNSKFILIILFPFVRYS